MALRRQRMRLLQRDPLPELYRSLFLSLSLVLVLCLFPCLLFLLRLHDPCRARDYPQLGRLELSRRLLCSV